MKKIIANSMKLKASSLRRQTWYTFSQAHQGKKGEVSNKRIRNENGEIINTTDTAEIQSS